MWLIVFDGLDEVPIDVKDTVSCEVRSFIDNVVTELDADVFTICTSRPQGYSGQFSDIDGPLVDLPALSSKQALQCAEPVLKIDRGEEEVSRFKEILKAAIESTSIQELMTTPLQAHIMAVVIRDGGKPPDRRWQLYNNFYQVIKKREANKSLRDPQLAKLLREDERLLKAVHNRLGFILHARAETSEGAQTHLDRSLFKDLVYATVSTMVERDIDKTVDALMHATTDRLVLVSTPDDGDHVRFDIRPLQEFFAAEFLYESVDATVLGGRMELLAGDSHWREVMHFLLSALVESARMTELAVGIEVLNNLNENEDEPSLRAYQRAMAGGALLAARLLQEGVLEQDKRIRQDFKSCLDPIGAFVEPDKLAPLIAVDRPNSYAWLQKFLTNKVLESSPGESVGALAVLVRLLPDGHERLESVINRLMKTSVNDLAPLVWLSGQVDSVIKQSSKPTRWFTKLVLGSLLGDNWFALTEPGVRAGLDLLRTRQALTLDVAQEMRLPREQISLLERLLKDNAPVPGDEHAAKHHGLVAVSYFQHDWTRGAVVSGSEIKSGSGSSAAPGILQLVDKIMRFSRTCSYSDLRSLLDYMSDDTEDVLRALPRHLTAFIAVDPWRLKGSTKALRGLNEEQFSILMRTRKLGDYLIPRPYRSITVHGGGAVGVDSFIEDMPVIAIHVLMGRRYDPPYIPIRDIAPLQARESINKLLDVITNDMPLLRGAAAYWGAFVRAAPERETQLRRSYMAAASGGGVIYDDMRLRPQEIPVPFNLQLPKEAPLLPYIVASVGYGDEHLGHHGWKMGLAQVKWAEFVADVKRLEVLVTTQSYISDIRAAALVFYLCHPKRSAPLSKFSGLVVELYAEGRAIWYLRGITLMLEHMLGSEEHLEAKKVTGQLLELTRDDYAARWQIQQMLAKWRERSGAPLSHAGLAESWLMQG